MSNFPTTVEFKTSELSIDVSVVEHSKKCKFVGDFCLKDRSGRYTERIAAIFWQEHPPVEGYSNYFGLVITDGRLMITDGSSAFDSPITALVTPSGEVVYSRHRWDYRQAKTASFAIDGGRDYTRVVGDIGRSRFATMMIDGPTINLEYHE